jgi:hypothetical protein
MEGIENIVAHILGLIGMAGVWLIPAHAWTLAYPPFLRGPHDVDRLSRDSHLK